MLYQNYDNLNESQKKDILESLYVKERKSFQDIAELYQTYPNKVRRDAKKFKITIRNKSEAQKNALKNGTHKHPTKGHERSKNTKDKIGKSVMKSWDNLSDKELKARKKKSKQNWESMDEEAKKHILQLANKATRESSKTGSKLEKFLLNKLIGAGYSVDFHKEQVLSNTKLQIDLFIPTIDLAIEVDGPSHFSPIWGKEVLDRNKKYDEKKNGLLIGKGLRLLRIKQKKDFSNARANMIYEKVLDIIKSNSFKNNSLIEIED